MFLVLGALLRYSPYPELERFTARTVNTASTVVTDRNGKVLRVLPLHEGLRREFVPLKELPAEVVSIFIDSEDRRFFFHHGIDGFAVLRSFVLNRRAGRYVSGGSTITMQLADMITPRPRTVGGKLAEAWDALRLDTRLTKKEILELWINFIPFGMQAEGIGSGGRTFFSKGGSELTAAEAAVLAVIPRHPQKYNPINNPETALEGALRNGRNLSVGVSGAEIETALKSVHRGGTEYYAPHFINRIMSQEAVTGRIRTTLDLEVQDHFANLLREQVTRYEGSRISGGAGVLLDNRTGEVLAYIGSIDFFSTEPGMQIDAAAALLQPGSCLKPFLYAAAVEEGALPNDILPDIPLDFGGAEIYRPMNFNNAYSGPVRFRTALASSLNIPAVYLLNEIGMESFAGVLQRAGVNIPEARLKDAGLGAALGGAPATLFELTAGFALFPRRGVPLKPVFILNDESVPGENSLRGISRYTADIICSILSDPAARVQGFGYNSAFTVPFPVMFKTGTSDQFQNIWALAATPDYTVGVWMGNLTGETVIGRTGSSVPARVAAGVLRFLRQGRQGAAEFPRPAGAAPVTICTVSGKKATPLCPSTMIEYIPEERIAGVPSCDYHVVREGRVVTQYPIMYDAWAKELGRQENCAGAEGDDLRIIRPLDGAVFYVDPALPPEQQAFRVEVSGGEGDKKGAALYINDKEFSFLTGPPYVWFVPLRQGTWELKAVSGSLADSVTIEVQ